MTAFLSIVIVLLACALAGVLFVWDKTNKLLARYDSIDNLDDFRLQCEKDSQRFQAESKGLQTGEGVFKIGMTRRLEPLERVKELGDASVPFPFDVHAMIYSEDAPALENALHERFESQRVNLVNLRREYFNVTLREIQDAVADLYGLMTFRVDPEAEQYRTTVAMRQEAASEVA